MSTPDPWPPLPGTPAIEALVAEVTRLRWRVEQLEIENRTHARMDGRLEAVERWVAERDAEDREENS